MFREISRGPIDCIRQPNRVGGGSTPPARTKPGMLGRRRIVEELDAIGARPAARTARTAEDARTGHGINKTAVEGSVSPKDGLPACGVAACGVSAVRHVSCRHHLNMHREIEVMSESAGRAIRCLRGIEIGEG